MVVRLAESLELTLRDRNTLLPAAGFAPVFPESDLAAPELAPVREALSAVLDGHLPYPALVARPRGELVTANAAFDLFTEGVADDLLRAPMNTLRVAMHPDGVAPRVRNLPEWGGTSSTRCAAGRPTPLTPFSTN